MTDFKHLSRERAWAERWAHLDIHANYFLSLERHAIAHGCTRLLQSRIDEAGGKILSGFMPATIELHALSKRQMENHIFTQPCVIISVTEPEQKPVSIVWGEHVQDVLRLSFHDEDNGECNDCGRDSKDAPGMRQEQGDEVIQFIEKHLDRIRNEQVVRSAQLLLPQPLPTLLVYLNCTAGMCRGPGIASALALIYNGDETYWWNSKTPSLIARERVIQAWKKSKEHAWPE